jgi:hypothetical protein
MVTMLLSLYRRPTLLEFYFFKTQRVCFITRLGTAEWAVSLYTAALMSSAVW